MNRDNQRSRVYKATWAANARARDLGIPMLVSDAPDPMRDALWFVRRISDWAEYRAITPRIQRPVANIPARRNRLDITLKRKGSRWSEAGTDWKRTERGGKVIVRPELSIAPDHLNSKWILIHEACHWVGEMDDLGHGPVFANAYLHTSAKFIDPTYADVLREEYLNHRVEW